MKKAENGREKPLLLEVCNFEATYTAAKWQTLQSGHAFVTTYDQKSYTYYLDVPT